MTPQDDAPALDLEGLHLRTVRNGEVRIRGVVFRPSTAHQPYDGRLDGHRFLFGTYRGEPDLLALWGTEEAWRATKRGDDDFPDGPELVDGGYPWYFWHAEK